MMNLRNHTVSQTTAQLPPTDVADSARASVPSFWTELFFGLLYALWGYAANLALLPFHARPFGIALLCGSDRRVWYIYAGLCLGAWQTSERWFLLTVYTALLALRILARILSDSLREKQKRTSSDRQDNHHLPLFSESTARRMTIAGIGAIAIGTSRLIDGGFLYYDLYGTLITLAAAPLAVLLFCGFFTRDSVSLYRHLSGLLSLAFVLVWSVRDQSLYGVSPSVFGSMFVTLYLTRKDGIIAGMIAGTVCGLAVSPDLAPLFAFSALSAGLLFPISKGLAVGTALSVGLAWGTYIRGIGILNGILAGLIASALLFAVLEPTVCSHSQKPNAPQSTASQPSAPPPTPCNPNISAIDRIRLTDTQGSIQSLCESFASLSDILSGMSRQMKVPSAADLRQICDNAFEASCVSCPDRTNCWSEHYQTTSAEIGTLCISLRQKGCVERSDAAPSLAERCQRLPDVLEEINHHAALHQNQLLQSDRTEFFASDYQALSDLLAAAMIRQETEYAPDLPLSEQLCAAFHHQNLSVQSVIAMGSERKRIRVTASDRACLMQESARITKTLQSVCPFPIESGAVIEEESAELEYWEAEHLSVTCAQRTLCAEGEEEYCGDTVGLFRSPQGKFYALISDGMGAGREASLTSGICGVFLKKMLTSGSSCTTAIGMLNHFLRNRGNGSLQECSATIDLMELNLLKGRASFHKCGAAPTYIFRDGSLFKLRSHTVPIGIIEQPDTRKLGFDIDAGDVIVMVSDGVTQGKEECPWLFDLLRAQGNAQNPERLADLILKYAKGEGSPDDLSVLVIRIEQK